MDWSEQPHRVRKETLELALQGGGEAWSFQQRAARLNQAEVLPILDEVFSALCPPEASVRIDRMVIDLGRISLRNFEKELPGMLRQRAFEAVKSQVKRAVSAQQNGPEIRDFVPREGERSGLLSNEQSGIELLRFFMETGVLPWWAGDQAMEEVLDHLVEAVPDELKTLVEENLKSEPFRKRLVYQFPHALLIKVLSLLRPGEVDRIEPWFQDLEKLGEGSNLGLFKTGKWRHIAWDHVFMNLAGGEGPGDLRVFDLLGRLAKEENMDLESFLKRIREGMSFANRVLRSEIRPLIDALVDEEAHGFQPTAVATSPDEPAGPSVQHRAPGQRESSISKLALWEEAGALDSEQLQVRVENAGLVLLWPFLGEFFENLGYVNENGFVDQDTNLRAVHVLEYAGTGKEHRPEPFLALNKVLCGLDVTVPILRETELTETEKEKSEELLAAVVSRWPALKSTSVHGFRSAFLNRQGLLTRKGKTWILHVERESYDLLLESLPWSLSMIRFSWMEAMMRVEW